MQPMFFASAPSFDELVEALRQLEARIKRGRVGPVGESCGGPSGSLVLV
jgi:hypothetical protein